MSDINELDVNEEGLKGIFGERFTDLTSNEKNAAVRKERAATNTAGAEKKAEKSIHHPTHEYKDDKWEPVGEPPKRTPNWMDNLKDSAKWVCLFGGLSFLVFYWEQAGLMAESIAVPCMCLCTALAGWGAGKTVRCK